MKTFCYGDHWLATLCTSVDSSLTILTGELTPGRDYDALAQPIGTKRLAVVGVMIPHNAVINYDADTRSALGALFRLVPDFYVLDPLSKEWALHFGVKAELGGHPAWLATREVAEEIIERETDDDGSLIIAHSPGLAFACALARVPFAIVCPTQGTSIQEQIMNRWAAVHGLTGRVAPSAAVARALPPRGAVVPEERLEAFREQARQTLARLVRKPRKRKGEDEESVIGLADRLVTTLPPTAPATPGRVRRLDIGQMFNPETHYDDSYYGVNGGGLEYMKPDGSWAIYRGTAHHWESNRDVAQILRMLLGREPGRKELLWDLGCGAGDFVREARAAGFDAWGMDISKAAVERAPADVREYLRILDIVDADPGAADVITMWDVWEHIWPEDVDKLVAAVARAIRPGGYHFAIVCTHGDGEDDHVLAPGVKFSRENSWLLCSGHVHIRRWSWWARKFKEHGLRMRYDLSYLFQVRRSENAALSGVLSWRAKNFFMLEKV